MAHGINGLENKVRDSKAYYQPHDTNFHNLSVIRSTKITLHYITQLKYKLRSNVRYDVPSMSNIEQVPNLLLIASHQSHARNSSPTLRV